MESSEPKSKQETPEIQKDDTKLLAQQVMSSMQDMSSIQARAAKKMRNTLPSVTSSFMEMFTLKDDED